MLLYRKQHKFMSFSSITPSISSVAIALKKNKWCNTLAFPEILPDEPWMHLYQLGSSDKSVRALGYDFFNKETAGQRALSEFIERYMYEKTPLAAHTIQQRKVRDTTSARIILRHNSLHVSDTVSIGVVKAKALHGIIPRSVLIPAQLCSQAYIRERNKKKGGATEPLLQREFTTNGLSTSWKSPSEAELRSILELIERDACMHMYRTKLICEKLNIEELVAVSSRLAEIREQLQRAKLDVVLTHIPTDFPVYVVAAYVFDHSRKGPWFCVGTAARFDILDSTEAALREALAIRCTFRLSGIKEHVLSKEVITSHNRYDRLRLWLNPKTFKSYGSFLTGGNTASLSKFKTNHAAKTVHSQLHLLLKAVRAHKYHCYAYKFPQPISPFIYTTKVIIPELIPITLQTSDKENGISQRYLDIAHQLNLKPVIPHNHFPHPFI